LHIVVICCQSLQVSNLHQDSTICHAISYPASHLSLNIDLAHAIVPATLRDVPTRGSGADFSDQLKCIYLLYNGRQCSYQNPAKVPAQESTTSAMASGKCYSPRVAWNPEVINAPSGAMGRLMLPRQCTCQALQSACMHACMHAAGTAAGASSGAAIISSKRLVTVSIS
jgi:hypothetical protein